MSDKCIYCGEVIDEDRLWFLNLQKRTLTCQNCTMEKCVHKEKVKIVKSKTDREMKNDAEKRADLAAARKELKKYNKYNKRVRHNKNKKGRKKK